MARRSTAGKTGASAGDKPASVDAYIAAAPENVRPILERIRAIVRREAPEAEERISYHMPAYHWHGVLLYFAAFKSHIGLYPPVTDDVELVAAVARFANAKGNLAFPLAEPIPYDLIERIVRTRVQARRAT